MSYGESHPKGTPAESHVTPHARQVVACPSSVSGAAEADAGILTISFSCVAPWRGHIKASAVTHHHLVGDDPPRSASRRQFPRVAGFTGDCTACVTV
jgi:hypothetical protein